ncbi:hypothetical protein P4N68_07920 [Corynebacterium felinum]|uniref:Uncharacterized protein n=1 Tax=Corynebacterium felinum TaxID=131318 RepID=A0ABU2BEN3_9CORY|nr:hypothetical protein [Corynebacterium felinum]MDF5821005.1 hypothetical protein [Corynebacterium felinum]MDR7356188.1 hypothetical protein [Corynebacterium felinum]
MYWGDNLGVSADAVTFSAIVVAAIKEAVTVRILIMSTPDVAWETL